MRKKDAIFLNFHEIAFFQASPRRGEPLRRFTRLEKVDERFRYDSVYGYGCEGCRMVKDQKS